MNHRENAGSKAGTDTGSDPSAGKSGRPLWQGSRRQFLGTTARVGAALGVATAGTTSAQADGTTVTVSDDTAGDAVELSLQPADSDVGPGGQQTHDLLVEGAASGVGSYDATIAVGDTSLLTVDDARAFQTSAGLFETTIAEDGSSVQFAGLVQLDAASQLTLAEIDVAAADTTGETSLDLSVADIADTDAESYTVNSAAGATVTVSEDAGPPALPGQDSPPQDLDGDGLYRDINGDGSFTIADVQVFFQNRDSDAVQNNPECFNFDETDPPEVSIGDVQALFQDFTGQSEPELPLEREIDPTRTYIRTNNDAAGASQPIDIGSLGVQPGMSIRLERLGSFTGSGGGTGMTGVFSGSETIESSDMRNRIPDAIDAGEDTETQLTYYGEMETDIPEDFLISANDEGQSSVTVTVPDGATHLFVAAIDNLYEDNGQADPPFALRIESAE